MIVRILVALIRAYQRAISPLLGNVCRFEPSCSRYAVGCLEEHGALRGSLLSFWRVCKCHPFHPGGFDPPPRALREKDRVRIGHEDDGTANRAPEPSQHQVEQG